MNCKSPRVIDRKGQLYKLHSFTIYKSSFIHISVFNICLKQPLYYIIPTKLLCYSRKFSTSINSYCFSSDCNIAEDTAPLSTTCQASSNPQDLQLFEKGSTFHVNVSFLNMWTYQYFIFKDNGDVVEQNIYMKNWYVFTYLQWKK